MTNPYNPLPEEKPKVNVWVEASRPWYQDRIGWLIMSPALFGFLVIVVALIAKVLGL